MTMTAAPIAPPQDVCGDYVRCTEFADLVQIFEPDVQVVEFLRPADTEISSYLAACVAGPGLGLGFRASLSAQQMHDPDCLPDLPGRAVFLGDVRQLTLAYLELIGCDAAATRLEIIGKTMCPRFHVDRVGVRLLCTYRGPGTDVLDGRHADRSRLGAGASGLPDETSGVMREAGKVKRLAPFAIVLLKGSLWQGNAGRGAIHRSPTVVASDAPRVLLAIDAIWD